MALRGDRGSGGTGTWTRVAAILIAVLIAVTVVSLVLRLVKLLVFAAAIAFALVVVGRALRGPR